MADAGRAAAWTAATVATLMLAQQVAAKAARDALFLTAFPVRALPLMVVASALVSVALLPATTRALSAAGPARLVPLGFAASAALLGAEWVLSGPAPGAAAIALYLHVAALNAVLISWFWSLVNERFDPRTARRQMRTMGAGAAFGGLVGGLVAERGAVLLGPARLLLVLAGMHLVCALATRRLGAGAPAPSPAPAGSGLAILVRSPYLRDLALLVAVGTIAATLLDYVFKAAVAEAYPSGTELVRFFALFYAATGLATFLVQSAAARLFLERAGLGATAATLPVAVAATTTLALAVPGLAPVAVARGAESSLHNSLFRSAYELFFTPLPEAEKRRVKTLIDVGCDRLGDALGGGLLLVVLAVTGSRTPLLALAAALALGMAWLTFRLQRGYVRALARSLRDHHVEAAGLDTRDSTTLGVLRSLPGGQALPALPRREETADRPTALASGDLERVRRALASGPLDEATLAPAITLLAWDDAAPAAAAALRQVAAAFVAPLVRALGDPAEEFAVRRRLPRVLAHLDDPRVVDGLVAALGDARFEVRYRAGRALDAIQRRQPSAVAREPVLAAVRREVAVDRAVWESQRLLDQGDDADPDDTPLDEFVRERSSRSLEHVFTLLSLAFPRRPLRIAFQALGTRDERLRGTALEYLESALPPDLRELLWPFLEDRRPPGSGRPREEVLDELLRSHQSIQLHLEEMRQALRLQR